MNRKTILFVSGLVILVLITLGVLLMWKKSTSIDPQVQSCTDLVKNGLKSPASAIFDNIEKGEDGVAEYVRGTVDSQNSYGAMMRTKFVCVIDALGKIRVHTTEDEDGMYEAFGIHPFDKSISPEERSDVFMDDLMKDIENLNSY